jgi:hypothetical protein
MISHEGREHQSVMINLEISFFMLLIFMIYPSESQYQEALAQNKLKVVIFT